MRLRLAFSAAALAACSHPHELADASPPIDGHMIDGGTRSVVTEIPLALDRNLDLLFVIDNSGSMKEEQQNLVANFPKLVNVLSSIPGGLPDVHIGVVSSNLGVGNWAFQQCPVGGDAGHLLQGPDGTHCASLDPNAKFISDVASGQTRTKNYTGALEDTFSCMAQLGTSGCGLESHLESMKVALDPATTFNAGFLRPEAYLGVVFVGDEDDCSASDVSVFDPSDTTKGGINFRCTEYGVTCDGDQDPLHMQTEGDRTNCAPREDSTYLYHVDRYIGFLRGLKTDPSHVVVADIGGPSKPVSIGPDTYENMPTVPALQASCQSTGGYAFPAVRRAAVVNAFGVRGSTSSICNPDLSDAMTVIAQQMKSALGDPCITGTVDDVDPSTPGLQADCEVTQIAGTTETPLAQCLPDGPGAHSNTPCWYLDVDALQCASTPDHLKLVFDYTGTTPPANARLRLSCVAH
ncbi:MAG TPA: vWA domain-containing protein [Kofleriaceae bacterium]|nr:vWA domain-containing protein [Kofleriaceae bacterium]